MYIKTSKYAFYRIKHDYVYLFNQLNYAERYYNLNSIDFFHVLSKMPQALEVILDKLKMIFNANAEELRNDFLEFIKDLECDGFVVIGKSLEELAQKELKFSYKRYNELKKKKELSDTKNIETNLDIIQQNTEELYVENLYLEVTRRCNERCLHCYIPQHQRSNGKHMSFKDAKKYIDDAKKLGVWELTITGGEPFFHPQISEILMYAREKDVIISILSNLTVLNDNHLETLKEIYPSHIQVSLYSLKPEVHDAVTGFSGSHQKTMTAMEKCYENDIPLQVNCPIIEINKNDYQDVLKWARAKGMKANADFNIMAQTDFELKNMENALSFENSKKVYIEMLKKDFGLFEDYRKMTADNKTFILDPSRHVCGAALNTLYISSVGKVYPCANWQSFELGDLNSENLKDIYLNGKNTKEVRNVNFQTYLKDIQLDLIPYIKYCPSHFANSNKGDYFKIPADAIQNARMKKDAVDEMLGRMTED